MITAKGEKETTAVYSPGYSARTNYCLDLSSGDFYFETDVLNEVGSG
jgi:hypothetical protein